MASQILQGSRLRFRALEPEDARAVWEIESDTAQWRQNGMMAPFSLRNLKEYALNYEPDPFRAGQIRFVAERLDGAEDWNADVVGLVDLYDISAQNRTAWVGIYVRPCFRGAGYGPEMLQILQEYAVKILNLRQMGAKIVADNESSLAIFRKAGYTFAGSLPGWMLCEGIPVDLLFYHLDINGI